MRSDPVRAVQRLIAILLLALLALLPSPASAKNGITAIWEPIYNQLEVFWIGEDGALRVLWKGANGHWIGPVGITPTGSGIPGSEVTALWSVMNNQLEVFWVGQNGEVNFTYKANNGYWNWPAKLTGPGFAVPGAPLTGFWQPTYHHLELFGIAPDGALSHVYKTDNKKWNAAGRLYGPGFGVPGSAPIAIYQPTGGQSQVFATGPDGAVNLIWKPYNEGWKAPFPITAPGAAPAGAWLDAVYVPKFDQLEVFFTDRDGAAVSVWKRGTNIYAWNTTRVGTPGYAPPGAPISAVVLPLEDHLEVFSIGKNGAVNDVWKGGNGGWAPFFATAGKGASVPGNTISGVLLPSPAQIEVFYFDKEGAVWNSWKSGNEPWSPPLRMTKAKGASLIDQDYCFAYWRDLYEGRRQPGVDLGIMNDCRPFAPSACGNWHMGNPPTYLKNGDNFYLLLGHSRMRDPSVKDTFKELIDEHGYNKFGGYIIWYKDYVGNARTNKTGRGQIFNGLFHPQQGRISFQANLWVDISEGQTIFKYGGVVNAVFPGPNGIMYGSMEGSFFEINGRGGNTWWAPVEDQGVPIFCRQPDLKFLAPPAPVSQGPVEPKPAAGAPAKPAPIQPPAEAPPAANAPATPPISLATRMPTAPSPAPGVSFTGSWVTFVRNGVVYNLTMSQDSAGRVSGDYSFGKLSKGVVVGRDLYAVWTQGSATGTVVFHMAPDSTSFAGMWAQEGEKVRPHPGNAKGSWDGYSSNVFTKSRQTGAFAGGFELDRDGTKVPLELVLEGDRVSGTFGAGSLTGTFRRFTGRPSELTVSVADGANRGEGTFYLYPDGSGFSGYWHSGVSGLNAWSGRLVTAPEVVAELPPAAPPLLPVPVIPAPAQPAPPPVVPTPVAKVPAGLCPAPTARVTQQLNMRDGAGGAVIGSAAANSRVQCLACEDGWCLIASSNPRSTVSQRYLEFEVAVAAPANPPPVNPGPANPAPAQKQAEADFTGRWTVTSDKGWTYYFRLNQSGQDVVGFYIDQSGATARFKGDVKGNVFSYGWDQDDGFAGGGSFTLEGDQLSGTYVTNPDPRLAASDLRGTWGGERSAPPTPGVEFWGPFTLYSPTSGATFNMTLDMDLADGRISGSYATVDGSYPGTLSGWVTGNTIVYEWTQPGDYSGGGVFTYSDNRIDGPYKSRRHPQLTEEARAGTWGGPRGATGGKTQPAPKDDFKIPIDMGGCAKCDDEPEQPK